MKVGVVYDSVYLEHDTGEHPENRARLEAVVTRLKESGTWDKLVAIPPRPVTSEELLRVHSEGHIWFVRDLAACGGGKIDSDTVVSPRSAEAALYAAGGAVRALELVMGGAVSSAFALVRPPGHHATRNQAMGFCLFNNIAVVAACALNEFHLERVLILDFDVHHGNGTQDIFRSDPRVAYVSVHQSPLFPGSGDLLERGAGNIFNVPLPPGCGDDEYRQVFDEIVSPLVRRFRPQVILVSAGFDAHWADDLASMRLSITGYAQVMRSIKALADELCGGKLVLCLEGGYNLDALAGGVEAVFDVLLGSDVIKDALGVCPAPQEAPDIAPLLAQLKTTFGMAGT